MTGRRSWLAGLCAGLPLLGLLLGALPARADCRGTNLFDALAQDNPAAHTRILADAAQVPNNQGNFWRVERDGIAPSHILGTFHSPEVVPLIPNHVWQALDDARVVALEFPVQDIGDFERRVEDDISVVFDLDGPRLEEVLDASELSRLIRVLDDRQMSYADVENLRSWMLFFFLSIAPCETAPGYEELDDLDHVVSARAAAKGIPEVGLEAIDRVPEHFDAFSRAQLVRLFIEPEEAIGLADDFLWTGVEMYGREQTAIVDLWSAWLGRSQGTDPEVERNWERLRTRLVDDRNIEWMANLEWQLSLGNAFVAVGTGHLPGENGLVAMLRARGWRLTRVPFARE